MTSAPHTPQFTRAGRLLGGVAWGAMALALAAPAWAQTQPTPPEHYTLDPRGVDLVTGRFNYAETDVVIGQPGQGGLVHGRVFVNGGWRDTLSGTIAVSGAVHTVSLGAISEVFIKSGSTFTPTSDNGSKLVQSGSILTLTTSDGTVANYSTSYSGSTSAYQANNAVVQNITRPNGEVEVYSWNGVSVCIGDPELGCGVWKNYVRLQTISNSYGYQINFAYASDDVNADILGWQTRVGAVGVNRAYEDCYIGVNGCAVPAERPRATYNLTGGNIASVTDQAGRTTSYTYVGGGLSGVQRPGSTSNDITVSYAGTQVSTVAGPSGTWNYAYSGTGAYLTTAATGPLGQSLTAVYDPSLGRATSLTDGLGRTTSYEYDSQVRLQRVTQPGGNYTQLTYNARGNVTEVRYVPKTDSGLPIVTTSATYPTSCANPVTCNQPTSTTDERGGVTDYAYDSVHGGVTTITRPAPTAGADRPQTRVSYAVQAAQLKTPTGSITPSPWPVTLPVAVSTCATGSAPSCVGTSAEIRTSLNYGPAGVANNLLPASVTTGAGDGSLTATTATTYTPNGDVATVDGPLPGAADTVTYRYDTARRPVGVIGPDPDGGGPLLRRAQRATYDAQGQVTWAEQGTVNGVSDSDWASFSSLQQTAMTYDILGRVTHQASHAGGAIHSVQQVSYDAAGRANCSAVRMNPATFSALPASACDPGAQGAFGPDRISKSTYDEASQLTSTATLLGAELITESVTYSANGKPLTLTDAKGNLSTIEYDGFDRPAKMLYPNPASSGSSPTDYEQYTYHAAGNALTYRNRGGDTFTSGYDALGRTTSMTGGGVAARSYTYDNLGRTLSASGDGQTLSFAWDALGRRTSETGPLGTTSSSYDLAGRRTGLAWPDGFFVNYDYNVAGDMTAIRENGATSWQLASWAYDNLGRRTAMARANAASTAWNYDAAGHLGSLGHDLPGTADDQSLSFTYNPAGQIVSRSMSNAAYAYAPAAGTTSYVNNGKNQVTSVGGSAISYDGRQNITVAPMGSYAYNGLNQMTSATVGGSATTFGYDPAGRMYQMGATRLLHDGARPMAEYDASGNILRRYVPGLVMDETVTAYEGAGLSDRRWLLEDERGSVTAHTNGSSGVLARNTYDEYGRPGAGNAGLFQYTGQMWMPQAQAYHYKARAYAPQLGRFMQADPIGYSAGANLYAYVGGDPVNATDPWGLQATNPGIVDLHFKCFIDAPCYRGGNGLTMSEPRGNPGGGENSGGDGATTVGEVVVVGKRRPHRFTITRFTMCSADGAFSLVARPGMSAPGAPAARDGFIPRVVLWGNNPISQYTSFRDRVISNTTLFGHDFYPGNVHISVVDETFGSTIKIVGTGDGSNYLQNYAAFYGFFGTMADTVQMRCSSALFPL